MAFVTHSNRPQPLWQPPSTAHPLLGPPLTCPPFECIPATPPPPFLLQPSPKPTTPGFPALQHSSSNPLTSYDPGALYLLCSDPLCPTALHYSPTSHPTFCDPRPLPFNIPLQMPLTMSPAHLSNLHPALHKVPRERSPP